MVPFLYIHATITSNRLNIIGSEHDRMNKIPHTWGTLNCNLCWKLAKHLYRIIPSDAPKGTDADMKHSGANLCALSSGTLVSNPRAYYEQITFIFQQAGNRPYRILCTEHKTYISPNINMRLINTDRFL